MEITDQRVYFVVLWIALMLVYLLGDVLRIFAGDFISGEIDGQPVSQSMWLLAAVIMVIPIIMVVLNLVIPQPYMKWANISVAIGFFLFNLAGIVGYKPYDQFLLIVSFGINFITVYFAFII